MRLLRGRNLYNAGTRRSVSHCGMTWMRISDENATRSRRFFDGAQDRPLRRGSGQGLLPVTVCRWGKGQKVLQKRSSFQGSPSMW